MSEPKAGPSPEEAPEEEEQEPDAPASPPAHAPNVPRQATAPLPQAPKPPRADQPPRASQPHQAPQVPEAPHVLPPEARLRPGGPRALPPHAAAQAVASGAPYDANVAARRGRGKLAVATMFAMLVVFFELLWLQPGVGIAFGVVVAPLMVYLIRITRSYAEGESAFRRGMADTGTIIITIVGALLFMFVSFATLFWIVCGHSHF